MLVILHEQVAILFHTIQNEVNVIVHQTEANDLDRMFKTGFAETNSNPIDPGNELYGGAEEEIVLQPLGSEMIIMRLIHSFFLKDKHTQIYIGGQDGGFKRSS